MLKELEDYAHENRVPIMLPDGIEYLCNYISDNKVKNILEIGSAIGYSAIKMAMVNDDVRVTTIEKDVSRYNMAVDNIKKFKKAKNIFVEQYVYLKNKTYLVLTD